jgi:hypothetical protein
MVWLPLLEEEEEDDEDKEELLCSGNALMRQPPEITFTGRQGGEEVPYTCLYEDFFRNLDMLYSVAKPEPKRDAAPTAPALTIVLNMVRN